MEEIERVAKAGKPVMLYFSKSGADPETLDPKQLERLREFKKQTSPNALTESYKSVIEFRDKFARQIEIKVRDLQAMDQSPQGPPLTFGFLTGSDEVRERVEIEIAVLRPTDLQQFLDLEDPKTTEKVKNAISEKIAARSTFFTPLAVRNGTSAGIRNLFCEMLISSTQALVVRAPSHNRFLTAGYLNPNGPVIRKNKEGGEFSFEWDALQPQRIRLVDPDLSFAAPAGRTEVTFTANVYAENFPKPLTLTATAIVTGRPENCKVVDLGIDFERVRKGTTTVNFSDILYSDIYTPPQPLTLGS